jgi:hypothetical protein
VSIRRRVGRLEDQTKKASSEWKIPLVVRLVTKEVERSEARREGREPPPYTQEEIEEMRQNDLETIGGVGVASRM